MFEVLVVILIVLIYFAMCAWCKNFITGMWIADDDFCESAGIDSLYVVIGPEDGLFSSKREAVFVYGLGEGVASYTATIDARGVGQSVMWSCCSELKSTWKVTWEDGTDEHPFDAERLDAVVDIARGELRLYDGDELCVVAKKQY